MNIGTNKCYCYQKETKLYYPYDGSEPRFKTIEYCIGTKEYDPCSCGGDPSKCDFYKDKRKENKMNTLDMMNLACKNGKTYRSNDLLFNTEKGFHDTDNNPWCSDSFDTLNDLFSLNEWETVENIMTKEEAEEKYGIKIVEEYPKKLNTRIGYSTAPKAVYQMDIEGNILKEWRSLSEASNALNIAIGNLSTCCNKGRPRTVGGYRWKFKEEE